MSDIRKTLYEPNGGPLTNKDACNIMIKKRHAGVVYCPAMEERRPGAMYPRAILLEHNGEENGTILATFEQYTFHKPVFSIFESTDGGLHWKVRSTVEDTQLGFGMRYQPHLFELPVKCGELEAGTVLCAGNVIPDDMSETHIHIYKSCDAGRTWEFMSEIASGGIADVDRADKADKDRPVWEPFLYMTKNNELICYYSDEGYFESENCNQLLLHKVSKDGGYTWSEARIDVAMPDKIKRPGMPIVAKLPNGKYIMVYEVVNLDGIPVFFRISEDGEDWGDPAFLGNHIHTVDGNYVTGTPYVIWVDRGGENGTILVTGRGYGYMLANSNLGEGPWEKIPGMLPVDITSAGVGYSQCMLPINGGKQLLSLCTTAVNPELAQVAYAIGDIYEK